MKNINLGEGREGGAYLRGGGGKTTCMIHQAKVCS